MLSLAHAYVDAASFAHSPSSSSPSLPTLSVPPPNLPNRSELQSPIQGGRVHQAFRFPVVGPTGPVVGAGEDAPQQQQHMPMPMSFRWNMMMGAMGAKTDDREREEERRRTESQWFWWYELYSLPYDDDEFSCWTPVAYDFRIPPPQRIRAFRNVLNHLHLLVRIHIHIHTEIHMFQRRLVGAQNFFLYSLPSLLLDLYLHTFYFACVNHKGRLIMVKPSHTLSLSLQWRQRYLRNALATSVGFLDPPPTFKSTPTFEPPPYSAPPPPYSPNASSPLPSSVVRS